MELFLFATMESVRHRLFGKLFLIFDFFKIQQGPLKISSVAEVMKESKQPTTKSQTSKPEAVAPSEEKEGNFTECPVERSKRLNDLLRYTS